MGRTDRAPREDKRAQVDDLRARLQQAVAAVLTDYRGLNVGELAALRGRLREAGVEFKVVKNTLLARAAASLGITGLAPYLEGPTAVAFSRTDPVGPAKILFEYIRQMRKLEVKGAWVEGRVLTADQVKALADLPDRAQLLASAVGSMHAPLTGLVGVLTALQRNLVYALEQIRQQQAAA